MKKKERKELGGVYQWFLDYCRNQKGLSENTIKSYGFDLQTFFDFLQEKDLAIPDVTTRVIDEFINEQATKRKNSKPTIRHKIETLRAFFKYLYRVDQVSGDIMKKVDAPKVPKYLPKYLSPEQQVALIVFFDMRNLLWRKGPSIGQRDKAMTILFLETGLRVSELCNLKIRDIDFNRKILNVMGKGAKEAEVYLPARSQEVLRDYIRDIRPHVLRRGTVNPAGNSFKVDRSSREGIKRIGTFKTREEGEKILYEDLGEDKGFVFTCSAGKRLNPKAVEEIYHKASGSLGFRVHPHLLRHTFASNLRRMGADLLLIKEALRHEHVSTTQIYAHISNERYKTEIGKYLDQPVEAPHSKVVIQGPWAKDAAAVAS